MQAKVRFSFRIAAAVTAVLLAALSVPTPTCADSLSDQYAALQKQKQENQKVMDSDKNDRDTASQKKAAGENNINIVLQQTAILNEQMAALNAQIDSKNRDIAATQANIDANYSLYKQQLRAMYEAGDASYLKVLLSSESFTDFLTRAEVLKVLSDHNNKVLATLAQSKARLDADQASLKANQTSLASTKNTYDAKHAELSNMVAQQSQIYAQKTQDMAQRSQDQKKIDAALDAITAQQAAQNQHNNATGAEIVAYARNYLGYPYVFDTNGPKTFDCSGLTQWVYSHVAGIALPHFADDQAKGETIVNNKIVIRGHKITSKSDLQPGDLLFFDTEGYGNGYAGHVGIYIGNGQMLAADTHTRPVEITNLSDWNCYLWGWRFL